LLAVVDLANEVCECEYCDERSRDGGGETSSTGETRPAAAAALARVEPLFLPKLSFHFDGFLVMGEGVIGEGTAVVAVAVELADKGERGKRGVGKAYIATGSKGLLEALVDVERNDGGREEALDAMLISRARVWEAAAKVDKVSSWVSVGLVDVAPLPLRRPRFRRLVVDMDRDVRPSASASASSPSSSFSLSMTVESSSLSIAGPKDGARESERGGITGVPRTAVE
jgi:hypothetical protein